mmetsp:Transcript_24059/g.44299  ORF Transcript_24059/g.44299 Transcript_24059/m.44299 type:complete len:256 (+) Transcript_24059:1749-2516(+)
MDQRIAQGDRRFGGHTAVAVVKGAVLIDPECIRGHAQRGLHLQAAQLEAAQPFGIHIQPQHIAPVHDPVAIGVGVHAGMAHMGVGGRRQPHFATDGLGKEAALIKRVDHIGGQGVIVFAVAQRFEVDVTQPDILVPLGPADPQFAVQPVLFRIAVVLEIGVVRGHFDIELQDKVAFELELPDPKEVAAPIARLKIVIRDRPLKRDPPPRKGLTVAEFQRAGIARQIRCQRQVAVIAQSDEIGHLDPRAEVRGGLH